MNNLCEFMEKNHIVPTAGFLPRFTNLAICIPAHAIAAGVWKRLLQKTFKNIVNKYEEHGINLTSTSYIWLAIKMPWLLALAVKFKSL